MKILSVVLLILLLAGCASAPNAQAPGSSSNPNQPVPGNSGVGGNSGAGPAITPVLLTNGPLTLTIYTPQQNATVSESTLAIQGNVSEETVLTINDAIYTLPAGKFSQSVNLDEGPNAIQIVASDLNGNEVDMILSVTYQP